MRSLRSLLTLGFAIHAHVLAADINCLYAVSVGSKSPLLMCPDADPLEVAKEALVLSVMRALEIDPAEVEFRGCARSPFAVIEDPRPTAKPRYVVTYPTEVGRRFLAPITHELAHIMQMRRATGLSQLRASQTSLQIELGADFVVGYLFARNLSELNREEFQNNLSLVGSYLERAEDAHGTPDQRTAAFRLGAVNFHPYSTLTYARAIEYFLRNDLARLTAK